MKRRGPHSYPRVGSLNESFTRSFSAMTAEAVSLLEVPPAPRFCVVSNFKMNASQTTSSLIRGLRPAIRPNISHHIYARPLARRILLSQPGGFQAPFTTSPTATPPQIDASPSSSLPASSPTEDPPHARFSPPSPQPPRPSRRGRKEPTYQLTFTCKPCKHRSSHEMSRQGYHHGTVLITCPDCKNRHVISDHLKVRNATNP